MTSLFACCHKADTTTDTAPDDAAKTKEKTCCGRRFLCNCISSKTVFAISTVVGALFLAIGLLALAGYLAPAGGGPYGEILRQIQSVANCVSIALGSDLLTLAIFTSVFGAVFTGTGTAGLIIQAVSKRQNP